MARHAGGEDPADEDGGEDGGEGGPLVRAHEESNEEGGEKESENEKREISQEFWNAGKESCRDGDEAKEGNFAGNGEAMVKFDSVGSGEDIEGADDFLEVVVVVPWRGIIRARIGEERTAGNGRAPGIPGLRNLAFENGDLGRDLCPLGAFDELHLKLPNLVNWNDGAIAEADVTAELDLHAIGRNFVVGHRDGEGEGGDEIVIPTHKFGCGSFGALLNAEGEANVLGCGGGGRMQDSVDADQGAEFSLDV